MRELFGASAVIFGLVMYLMIAVMIDRSSFGISLLKNFGFRKGEIKNLYVMIFAGILATYEVINLFMMAKLNRVNQTEVLKNR